MIKTENIRWVLHNSCNDQNCLNRIPELTDEELRYCLLNEDRKTGLRNLLREAKKRNFPVTTPPTSPAERFLLFDAAVEEMVRLLEESSDEELNFILNHEVRENVITLVMEEKEKRESKQLNSPEQLLLF